MRGQTELNVQHKVTHTFVLDDLTVKFVKFGNNGINNHTVSTLYSYSATCPRQSCLLYHHTLDARTAASISALLSNRANIAACSQMSAIHLSPLEFNPAMAFPNPAPGGGPGPRTTQRSHVWGGPSRVVSILVIRLILDLLARRIMWLLTGEL